MNRDLVEEMFAVRGFRCRLCGDPAVEIDHLIPRSQGGRDVLENLWPLCGPWSLHSRFAGGCHRAKTERRVKISRDMLDDDQLDHLAVEGWVIFDGDRPVAGRGMAGFEDVESPVGGKAAKGK